MVETGSAKTMSGTTTLFTDIVDSTRKAVELGDGAWADLLERHNAVVRAQLSRFRGQEMDTSGDGFFAVFPDPEHAIGAARGIQAGLRELDLQVRIGIHVGDCWVADAKCTGLAIHVGARIAALAEADEILVSEAAKAEAGPAWAFVDRGETDLKGIPGRWHLYAVEAGITSCRTPQPGPCRRPAARCVAGAPGRASPRRR
jgi:class 3 adenylate cyclase